MRPSESIHRQTYLALLNDEIRAQSYSESIPFHRAATAVLLDWLGYDLDDVTFINTDDKGIDAWFTAESSIDIFQFKTHSNNHDEVMQLVEFDNEGVKDLNRARDFVLFEQTNNVSKADLKNLLQVRDSMILTRKYQPEEGAITITLHLVLLGTGLTSSASSEFSILKQSVQDVFFMAEVPIQIHVILHTVDEIINGKWREDNRKWVDQHNNPHESIDLNPVGDSISDNANAVFYCYAIDLVRAYDALGYQLFEPNVRANIKQSRVNEAIRNSVLYQKSRREFRFLNNGVTITCDIFTNPKGKRTSFRLRHPGIVNGLQTVVALHTAFHKLSDADRQDFEKNCHVLVRILTNHAVSDITAVVKATNNQNPMRPRNLVSNSSEQLTFVRLFSEVGWFYEAKQGAWDAFEKDPRRWRPNLNKRPRDFQGEHKKTRKIDNERLAQTWLSFIGFAPEAINRKGELFNDPYYSLIFKQQLARHGNFDSFSKAVETARNEAPHHYLLLLSYLVNEFARQVTPSARQNRIDACSRLGIDPSKLARAEVDARLIQDETYTLNQALNGMSMLFTEFFGYVLYEALGDEIQVLGSRLINNHAIHYLFTEYYFDDMESVVKSEQFERDDLLFVLWFAFVDTIQDMLLSGWGQSYRASNVKVRFIFSRETRTQLYREISNKNEFMKRRILAKVWAAGVPEGSGLFDFVRSIAVKSGRV